MFYVITFCELQDRFPVKTDETWMRNVYCNNDNVLECNNKWQIKSHKKGEIKDTLGWLAENNEINANVKFTSGTK